MATLDWKAPFLQFRDQIRPLFDSGVKLYHGVLMAPFHEREELTEVVRSLEACHEGKTTVAVIETPTDGCNYHAHYFFGDSGGCQLLGHALSGIDDWLRAVPRALLPEFNVPCNSCYKPDGDLATWVSVVYYLAWEINAPYLQGAVEYQESIEEIVFYPWSEWPQPEGCDPRSLLIHQGNDSTQFEKFLERFGMSEEFRWCPDIIDAYLLNGEFVAASLAAIDVLVFMLEQIRGKDTVVPQNASAPHRKNRQSRSRRVSNDLILLREMLAELHNPEIHGEKALIPLTAERIATALEWISKSGKPLQARVSRRMAELFGPNGMEKYRKLFDRGKISPGIFNRNSDGTRAVDGYDMDMQENDPRENDLD
jgi:hypothetical protein